MVQTFNPFQLFFILPRDAGEEREPAPDSIRGRGLNRAQRFNGWNVWNGVFYGS